ncbi:MAG: efflux RND transporter periplasmic adaptor subunit [Chloroflexota bacterium]
MKKQSYVLLLLLLAAFLLVGCNEDGSEDGVEADSESVAEIADEEAAEEDEIDPTPAPTRAPIRGTTILVDGQLVAVHPKVDVSFVVNGRLLTLNVAPGDNVSAGDTIAQLDDKTLQETVTEATLAVTQTENDLAQAQLSLDNLVTWEPDAAAVTLAEANLTAAQADLEDAQTLDASAGNSLTSVRIRLDQAQRGVADAQKAYDTAFDPGREWETHYNEPTCLQGQGGGSGIPCTGETFSKLMEYERDGATRGLQSAKENLTVAQAEYNLAVSRLDNNTALSAEASVANAEQSLATATTGPKESEIAAARLTLEKSELALEQAQFNLTKAQNALADAQLIAPVDGTVLAVNVTQGALVNAGTPIVTLQNTAVLQFHTTNLSERDLAEVTPDQEVTITLKTFPNDTISGIVARIVPEASGTVGDAATFTAVIDLNTTDLTLLPGMTGRAEIKREG